MERHLYGDPVELVEFTPAEEKGCYGCLHDQYQANRWRCTLGQSGYPNRPRGACPWWKRKTGPANA